MVAKLLAACARHAAAKPLIGGLAAIWALGLASPAFAQSLLHPLFQDHAVLQRDQPIPVYGTAPAGTGMTVTLGTARATGQADASGHWQIALPAMPAGGPYVLEVKDGSGTQQRASDVMVGDVFLCGGQSNMAFEVRQADNARADIAVSKDDAIRSLTIKTRDSASPLASFADPVQWLAAGPDTTGNFSAACYFFARDLRRATHVPVGMIVAAWGGSRARAWASEAGLRGAGLEQRNLDLLALHRSRPALADRGWDQDWERWWHAGHGAAAAPWSADFDMRGWKTAPAGLGPWALWTGSSPDGFVGQMWLRTQVTLTAPQAQQGAVLDLGMVNEEDESWINGKGVGGSSWLPRSQHEVPAGVLHAGVNSVTVNVFCSWRNCGLVGAGAPRAIRLADGSAVPLSEPWHYAEMTPEETAPQLPWGPAHGVSVIHNGMIAPIGNYGFKAALWYQGESDVHFAPAYERTLRVIMADWRRQFGKDLPFLIVQLPDFGPRVTSPTPSTMADIREAQRRAVIGDRHADYVVTIDIGNPDNIHPTNKQELGRRLALVGRRLVFGQPENTGPRADRVMVNGRQIQVHFVGVQGKLASYSGAPLGFELCRAGEGSCRFAPARIVDTDVVAVETSGVAHPTRIRFCWGDSPLCNLSDGTGLPAGPFDLAVH